jgi:hypothetical protein
MGKKRKFYRATLPTIVWNPKAGRALAEFVNGQFETEDDEVADTLKGMGYPEVKPDATEPPMLIPDPVPIKQPDVKVMAPNVTEKVAAARMGSKGETEAKGLGFTVVGDSLVDDDKSSKESGGENLKPAAVDKPKKTTKKSSTKSTKKSSSKKTSSRTKSSEKPRKTRKIKRRTK